MKDARHSLICHNFLPAWNHVMEMDAVINNKNSSEPNLIRFIQTVKHHTPQSANIMWPKYITYKKEKLIYRIANIIVAEESKTYLVTVKKKIPEYILVPMESDTTWPVRSISMQELIAVIFGFWAIIAVLFTYATSRISVTHQNVCH